ncbi:hypothetical protein ACI3PL_23785, partial [Lacticaseibacillus paracasei]
VYQACDNVIIPHRPELLGISKYGVKSILTTNLVHGGFIKSRFGNAGNFWLKNELSKGRFTHFTEEEKNVIGLSK